MKFSKMHGLGNDFVFVDQKILQTKIDLSQLARQICDRHFGIGADGLVLVSEALLDADYRMRIFNPDGSEPEMCGNALRCFAKYLFEYGKIEEKHMKIETLAGIMEPTVCLDEKGKVDKVCVNMGKPVLAAEKIPVLSDQKDPVEEPLTILGKEYRFTAVSMGNPHAVIFVDDVDQISLLETGPLIEQHKKFPAGVNVEFVQILNPEEIKMRVWERGAGATLACGTGACAAFVAGNLTKRLQNKVLVHLPGGDLEISFNHRGEVLQKGPAQEVFTGEFFLR